MATWGRRDFSVKDMIGDLVMYWWTSRHLVSLDDWARRLVKIAVVVLVVLQLWLLTATMNAYLGGDESAIWPAAVVSAICFLLNLGLLRYIYAMERS